MGELVHIAYRDDKGLRWDYAGEDLNEILDLLVNKVGLAQRMTALVVVERKPKPEQDPE